MVRQQIAPGFVQQAEQAAPQCVACGKAWRSNYKAYNNGKTETEKINLDIEVTNGMREGERITFEGMKWLSEMNVNISVYLRLHIFCNKAK